MKMVKYGVWTGEIDDGCRLYYYFNTQNTKGIPENVLNSVTAIYLQGYEPPHSILDFLPNLNAVFSTCLCVGKIFSIVMNRGGEGNLVTEATWSNHNFHVRKSELQTGAELFPSSAPIEIDEESEDEDEESEDEDSDE